MDEASALGEVWSGVLELVENELYAESRLLGPPRWSMLLLDLAAERRPDGQGWDGGSRLSTLPRELKWSEVRCRFVCSNAPNRSWAEELACCRPCQGAQAPAEDCEADVSGWLSETLVACQE